MTTRPDPDRDVERLLRRVMPAATATAAACLDAEVLAAWFDDSLDARARDAAEAHVAGCARCQAVLAAIVQSEPAPVAAAPWWRAPVARWLAPAALVASAVTVWILLPQPPVATPEQATQARAESPRDDIAVRGTVPPAPQASIAERVSVTTAEAPVTQAPVPASPAPTTAARRPQVPMRAAAGESAARQQGETLTLSKSAAAESNVAAPDAAAQGMLPVQRPADDARRSRDARDKMAAREPTAFSPVPAPPVAAGAAAPGSPAAAPAPGAAFAVREAPATVRGDIASPDRVERWRIRGATIEHSADEGLTWRAMPSPAGALLETGTSPVRSVCWMVGRAGSVVLTTNGTTFTRLPFPEAVDLVAIDARDARAASVVTRDGRTFTTADGGATWRRR